MVSRKAIENAAKFIRDGNVVAFPTETVYGLGANALNPLAVARVFEAKERPSFDPLIVHIADSETIKVLSNTDDDRVKKLAEKFWPGPLTIVLPKSEIVSDLVTSGLPTVGIRMPDNDIALALIRAAACPIAAPSANKFGRLSPTSADHVRKQLPDIPCILNGGPTKVGIESTVIRLHDDGFEILRHGSITEAELETVLPVSAKGGKDQTNLPSPGLLKSHYSPEKPIYLLHDVPHDLNISEAALLSFSGQNTEGYKIVRYLSHDADLKEAAVNLFDMLHELEEANVSCIVAEPVPEEGIGSAIMDKLRKAAFRYV